MPVDQQPTALSIKEANDHLQLVHSRLAALEAENDYQRHEIHRLKESNQALLVALGDERRAKREAQERVLALNVEIDRIRDQIDRLEAVIKRQEAVIDDKDKSSKSWSGPLTEIHELVPSLEKLLGLLAKLPKGDRLQVVEDGLLAEDKLITVGNGPANGPGAGLRVKKSVKYSDQVQDSGLRSSAGSSSGPAGSLGPATASSKLFGISLASAFTPTNSSITTEVDKQSTDQKLTGVALRQSSAGKLSDSSSSSPSTSSLRLARNSFNITANFSDEEDDHRPPPRGSSLSKRRQANAITKL